MNHLDTLKKELADKQAVLLDVREQDEWQQGHLEQAILVPLSDITAGIIPENLDKNTKTYIHCRSGKRVLTALPLLEAEGFENIITLDEGFEQLANYGFKSL